MLVLSGEHDGFSRLALVLPGPGGWTIIPAAGGYVLRLEAPGIALDTSRVFDLIPRDRIASVVARPDGLFLGVTCECHLRSFEDRPGVLVIDVVSGPDPADAEQAPLSARTPAPRPDTRAADASPAQPDPTGTVRPRPETGPLPPIGTGLGTAQSWLASRGAEVPAPPPSGHVDDPATEAARAALIAQISRAASQDVLQITPPAATPAPDGTADQTSAASASAPPESAVPQAGFGMSVGTVFDRSFPGQDAPALTGRGAICPSDSQLALGEWLGSDLPTVALAAARRSLLGEFDLPLPEAVLHLVRVYLSLGFGAEARAVLAGFPDLELEDRELLATVAAAIDDMPVDPGPLAGMEDCDTAASLWAVLLQPDPGAIRSTDSAAVVRAFSALPAALRQTLGARLVERLVAAGLEGTARSIAAALARAPNMPGDTLDLIEARLDLPQDPDAAAARLAKLAAGNGPESAEALILLVEADLARDAAIAPAVLDTLAARSFELRGTVIGSRLDMARALALGSAGAFDAAFSLARALAPSGANTALTSALVLPLLAMLVESADDASFLRHTLATQEWQEGGAPFALRTAMARRLIDLGLPAEALRALPDRARPSATGRLLRAEALLGIGDAAAALPLLAGLDDPGAAALRARALAALGDSAAAAAGLRVAGEPEAAGVLAWRAGDTALIAEYGTELQRRLAAPPRAEPPVQDAGGPLAQGKALIAESADLRDTIDALLATLPAP